MGINVQTRIFLIAVWLLMPSFGEEPDAAGICLSADVLKKRGRKNFCGPFSFAAPLPLPLDLLLHHIRVIDLSRIGA